MPHKRHHNCFIFLTFVLCSCQLALPALESKTSASNIDQASRPISSRSRPAPDAHRQHIIALLQAGNNALRDSRLTTPDDDNAYLRYSQVLNLEPENTEALLGLSRIVDAYLELAINQANRGKLRSAKDFVSKARSVDPGHTGIPAIATMVEDQSHTNMTDYLLPDASLSTLATLNRASTATDTESQTPALQNTDYPASLTHAARATDTILQTAARQIEQTNASIIIRASSDALGRQIYQYLNQATSKRIRAQFETSNQTRVSLYFH